MNRVALLALLAHWRRNPLQLVTLLAGLALATGLWSGVQAINAEARASYDAAAATLGEGQYDQLLPASGTIAQTDYIALRRAGWLVSPVVEGRFGGVRLIGLDPLTAPGGLGPVQLGAGDVTAFLSGAGQIFGRAEALAALADTGAALVDSPDLAPGAAITDIGTAQRLLGLQGQISRLIVAPVQPLRQLPLAEVVPGLVRRSAQSGSDVGRLTDSFHLNLTAFGLLSFAVGIFIVHGAIGLAFEQRRPVVRTLRALGMPLRRLMGLMALELAGLALLAGAIGIGLGYVVAAALLPDVAATLRGLYGADVSGTLALRPAWWLSGLAIALGGTAVAAAGAFRHLTRMPLLASAQPRAWAMQSGRGIKVQAAGALGLGMLSAGLALFGSGLVAGFALLAAMLIGAALALPLVLDRLLALGQAPARSVTAEWFWADSRQQLPGLALALSALLLAMAANVGVSTMVSSFRLTFAGFLDQRLAAELYVTTTDPAQAEQFLAYVTPRVEAVLPLMQTDTVLAGFPAELYAARDHRTYPENWRLLAEVPDVWTRLVAGDGVLVNEQLARRAGLALGDPVTVTPTTILPVIGIYGDYGNPVGQAVLTEALFRDLFPQVIPLRFGLRLDPADVASLTGDLTGDLGLPAAQIINQAAIKGFSMQVFDRTFTVTTALNILTLAVAGFAILMSLLTLATLRLPQLAPVWALGMTKGALGRLELVRAIMLALLTSVLALPLGLGLAWVLLARVNVEAFGWQLPMFLFPWDYLRLGGFAVLAAVVAAAWPALRLARTPPAQLLKVFSNER